MGYVGPGASCGPCQARSIERRSTELTSTAVAGESHLQGAAGADHLRLAKKHKPDGAVRRANPSKVCTGSVPRTIADGGFLAAQQIRMIDECKAHGLPYGGDKRTLRGRLILHYNNVTHAPMPRARLQPSEEFWANRAVAARQAVPARDEQDQKDPPPLSPPPPPPQAPAPPDEPESTPPSPAKPERELSTTHLTVEADERDEGDEGEDGDEGDDSVNLPPHLRPLVLPDEFNDLDEWDTSEEERHGFVAADKGSDLPVHDQSPRRDVIGRPESFMVRRYGWWVRRTHYLWMRATRGDDASPEY